MNEQRGRTLLFTMFLLCVAMVSWDEIKHGGTFPRPKRLVGTGLVFGILGFAAPIISYPLAGVLGAGMALTLLYKGVIGMGPGAEKAIGEGAIGGATTGALEGGLGGGAIGGVYNAHG